ncbi:hypothetical protein A2U01_0058377, partial [Trifolium medium]|nr:hypothetical protein [Trifolium medium]
MNGCRWSIGDGTKIKVMNEPWLKKEDGLFDDIANSILIVPLFDDIEEDKLVWDDDMH